MQLELLASNMHMKLVYILDGPSALCVAWFVRIQLYVEGDPVLHRRGRVIQLWVCGLVRWLWHLRRSLVIIDAKVCCWRFFVAHFSMHTTIVLK
jgi:hypothetical protein